MYRATASLAYIPEKSDGQDAEEGLFLARSCHGQEFWGSPYTEAAAGCMGVSSVPNLLGFTDSRCSGSRFFLSAVAL